MYHLSSVSSTSGGADFHANVPAWGCTGLANLDLGDCGADRITKIGVWHLALATPLRLSLQRLVLPSLYGCLSGIQLLRRLRDTPDDETDDDEWSDDDKL